MARKEYITAGCYGRSQKTGKKVGSRHRWENDCCIWCNRFRDGVKQLVKPKGKKR